MLFVKCTFSVHRCNSITRHNPISAPRSRQVLPPVPQADPLPQPLPAGLAPSAGGRVGRRARLPLRLGVRHLPAGQQRGGQRAERAAEADHAPPALLALRQPQLESEDQEEATEGDQEGEQHHGAERGVRAAQPVQAGGGDWAGETSVHARLNARSI